MPIVQIYLMEGRSDDKKRALVAEVTKAICKTVDVKPENVRIILSEMAPNHYGFEGKLVIDKPKKG
jgi:4-oxalocrotonate tautomerase